METFFGIIVLLSAVLSIVLFFKVWGMTNDVNTIKNHLASTDNDEYMMYLRHYTADIKQLFLESYKVKENVKIMLPDVPKYIWTKDFDFNIECSAECYNSKIHPDWCTFNFKIKASSTGNPRLRDSWIFTPLETTIPDEYLQ